MLLREIRVSNLVLLAKMRRKQWWKDIRETFNDDLANGHIAQSREIIINSLLRVHRNLQSQMFYTEIYGWYCVNWGML